MSNPFELRITLRQHTPIIHFQHHQDGATLRASEVKPKLDRFLIDTVFNNNFDLLKTYLIGYDAAEEAKYIREDKVYRSKWAGKEAFDYQIRIQSQNVNYLEINSFPLFFANMGLKEHEKLEKGKGLTYTSENIKIFIYSTYPQLSKKIDNNIVAFFANHNFGTRQGKGFGSFGVLNKGNYDFKINYPYFFDIPLLVNNTWTEKSFKVFSHLDIFYRVIRSGINIPKSAVYVQNIRHSQEEIHVSRDTDFYCKSLLFVYLHSKSWQWDKKSIKEFYLNSDYIKRYLKSRNEKDKVTNKFPRTEYVFEKGLKKQIDFYKPSEILDYTQDLNKEKLDFRDMFGLSSSETWHSYDRQIEKSHVKKDVTGIWAPVDEKNDTHIARFPSPIFFKPIEIDENGQRKMRFYFKINEIPKGYQGETFSIESSKHSSPPLKLRLPNDKEFSHKDYLSFIFDRSKIDIEKHINSRFHNYTDREGLRYYAILTDIFKQLQSSENNV